MLAIYKRELQSFLHSVIGFLFMAAILFIFGIYTIVYNVLYAYPYLSYAINSMLFLFMFAVPILTMRILAEERKQKIDQLTLTAPISVGKIVMGKFLACATIFIIPVIIMCLMPLIYMHFGNFMMRESYVAVLGYVLFGLACIAVSIFVSSFTESQVIAAVCSFVCIFLVYMMSGISSLISQSGNILTKIMGAFDFYTKFSTLMNGSLDFTAVVYFITVIVLMLFLTTQSIQKRRYSVSVANFSMSAFSSTAIVIAIVVAVFVNLAVGQIPSKYTAFDITKNQLYSITDQTEEVLKALDQDVTFYVYAAEDGADTTIQETLKKYEEGSKHIKVEYVDPVKNPQFAKQYSDTALASNSIVVASDKRTKVINYSEMYTSEMDYSTYQSKTTGYDGEGQLTSAIDFVTTDETTKMYVISGHNEVALDTSFARAIDKENITYEDLTLVKTDAIPEDAAAIIINAPQNDYSAEDAQKVIDYLDKGGKAFIVAAYTGEEYTNFYTILEYFGVKMQEGYVVENSMNYYYTNSQLWLLPEIESSAVTSSFVSANRYIFAPYSQGIEVPDTTDDAYTYTKLLSSTDQSFVKTDLNSQNINKEEGDIDGPICVGLLATKTVDAGDATLYLFGSSEMFTADADNMVSGTNLDLFSKILSTFANHENSVSIPVKSYDVEYLTFTQGKTILVGAMITVIVPLGLLIAGFVIWFRRRKK